MYPWAESLLLFALAAPTPLMAVMMLLSIEAAIDLCVNSRTGVGAAKLSLL